MQTEYNDYSDHMGLRICHTLGRLRHLPLRIPERVTRLLTRIVPKPRPEGSCIIKTIHGVMILVEPVLDAGLERELFIYGTYEEGTLRIIRHILRDGDTFIDIGANIGVMSLYAAKILNGSGAVLSFEALSSTYDILRYNIELNTFRNIKAVNIAMGSANGTADIVHNRERHRGSASLLTPGHTEASHRIAVTCLDGYLKEHGTGSTIGCIKIDVEGWELEVLKGARATLSGANAPMCIIECSTAHPTHGGAAEDIYTFLRNINAYRIFRLARGKGRPSRLLEIEGKDDLREHDNLFCFLPEHMERLPAASVGSARRWHARRRGQRRAA